MIGISLIDTWGNTPKKVIDLYSEDPFKKNIAFLGLHESDLSLYGDALSNVRILYGKTKRPIKDNGYDIASMVGGDKTRLQLVVSDFKELDHDECANLIVKDPAYKSVAIYPIVQKEEGIDSFSRPVNTGYTTIDRFINEYTLIRFDKNVVYSNYQMFGGTNDLATIVAMMAEDSGIEGVTYDAKSKMVTVDGIEMITDVFSNHDKYMEIALKTIYKVYRSGPIIIIGNFKIAEFAKEYQSLIFSESNDFLTAIIGV